MDKERIVLLGNPLQIFLDFHNKDEFFNRLTNDEDTFCTLVNQLFLLVITIFGYGVIMGSYNGFFQAISSGIKLPLLFLLALLICLPGVFILQFGMGVKLGFLQMLKIILGGFVISAVVLITFAPIVLFFMITGDNYSFMKLLHVAIFGFAGIFGMKTIVDALQLACEKKNVYPKVGVTIFRCWIIVLAFVGMQLSWSLRPFVGSRELPFEVFRQREGNFYIAVIRSAVDMVNPKKVKTGQGQSFLGKERKDDPTKKGNGHRQPESPAFAAGLRPEMVISGQAAFFDGVNDYVEVIDPPSPQNKRKKPRISRGDSTDSGSEASETEKPLLTWETMEDEKSVRLAVLARNLGATFSMDISSDGKHLIAGSSRGIVKIWNLEDFAEVLSLNKCLRPGVRRVAFSPDGQSFVAVGHNSGRYDQKIILRDAQSGSEKVRLSDSNDYCVAAVFGSAGKHIVGVDTVKGGIIKIWDTTNGRLLTRFRGKGPCALHSVAGSPDGTRFATGNSIRDVATGERIGTLHGEKLVCPWCITFSPDGEQIVTGHHDGMIYIWNSKDGSEIKNFLGHEGRVYCVAFDPSGQKLASAGLDKTVRIWDMAEEEEILTLRGHQDMVFSVAFSIDGKRLFSSSRDGTVRVWEIQPGK